MTSSAFEIYSQHFALRGRPFSLLPDPDFLFWSANHARAYAMLEYGLATFAPITVITGEIGVGAQSFDIGGRPRNFTGELLYAAPILDDAGEVGLFGRAELQAQDGAEINQFAVGGRVNVRF